MYGTPSSVSTQTNSVGSGSSTGYGRLSLPFRAFSSASSGPGEIVARCNLVTALVRSRTHVISACEWWPGRTMERENAARWVPQIKAELSDTRSGSGANVDHDVSSRHSANKRTETHLR